MNQTTQTVGHVQIATTELVGVDVVGVVARAHDDDKRHQHVDNSPNNRLDEPVGKAEQGESVKTTRETNTRKQNESNTNSFVVIRPATTSVGEKEGE